MFPPPDALLPLVIAFSITCKVARKNLLTCPPNPFSPASRQCCVSSNSWIDVMKMHLMMKKPRSFFYSFPKEHIQDYVYHGHVTLTWITLRISRISSRATMMLSRPKRMIVKIVELTRVKLLVVTASLSRPLKMSIHRMWLSLHLLATPLNDLTNALALVSAVTPVCHVPVTNVDSAKTVPSNRMTVPCITLPLSCKQQRF